MNCNLPTMGRALVALFAIALLPIAATSAQSQRGPAQGYQAPNFAGMAMHTGAHAGGRAIPGFPSSPLAGGPTAARGGDFMNVNGDSIVMPASYACQSCPGGYGGSCQCGPSGGDPMAVDFGGYGQEQSGPHYFDISAEAVFLQASGIFDGVGPFSSKGIGPTAPRYLSPANSSEDYDAGWQISGRYDIGALAVLEATYMGLYDIGFTNTIRSATSAPGTNADALFTPFSDFGIGTIVTGFDFGDTHTLDYKSDLQSTELSYRRYWLGNNPRVSGTWLIGARYLRMTEDFSFNSEALDSVGGGRVSGNRLWASENDMVGFQLGGDGWIALRQGLRVGCESKAGIYNNHFKFRHAATLPAGGFDTEAKGDQVAFVAEGNASVVVDLLPSWSLRGSYRVLYMSSLATAGNNIDPSSISSTAVSSQGHALYHGFSGGVEYVW